MTGLDVTIHNTKVLMSRDVVVVVMGQMMVLGRHVVVDGQVMLVMDVMVISSRSSYGCRMVRHHHVVMVLEQVMRMQSALLAGLLADLLVLLLLDLMVLLVHL